MRGIYIPGMEMPNEHITLEIYKNGEVWEQNWQGDGTLVGKAILVSDHGRLGDLDELAKSFRTIAEENYNRVSKPSSWAHAYYEAEGFVEEAPTIIPADKG